MIEQKIKKFVADKVMFEAVKDILEKQALKVTSTDVHHLAASRISLDVIKNGFKELEQISKVEERNDKPIKQVGL